MGPDGGCGAGTLPLEGAQAAMLGSYASAGTPPPTGVATLAQALAEHVGAAASVAFARGANTFSCNVTSLVRAARAFALLLAAC